MFRKIKNKSYESNKRGAGRDLITKARNEEEKKPPEQLP
jgi:hypothetical protein